MTRGESEAEGLGRGFVSLGWKLAIATLLILATVSAMLFVQLTGRERQSLVAGKRTATAMVADLFAAGLTAPLDFGDADAVDAEVRNLKSNRDLLYVAVWQSAGMSPIGSLSTPNAPDHPTKPAMEDRTTVLDDRIELVRRVVTHDDKVIGAAVLQFSLAPEDAAYAEARSRFFWFSALLALGTTLALITLARKLIIAPLAGLVAATRQVRLGKTRTRVKVSANDELGRLVVAFNEMTDAIVDREAKLAEATRSLQEVLDNTGQAIVVFGHGGMIEGARSRQAATLFGKLSDRSILDALFPNRRPSDVIARSFEEWLDVALAAPDDSWVDLIDLAPREIVLQQPSGEDLLLEIELRRMPSDKKGRRIMLLATDVTEKRNLERAVLEKDVEHARQMAAMRRLVTGGGHVFVAFLEATAQRLERCRAFVREGGDAQSSDVESLFQHVHTIKGEARSFGLDELETHARAAEGTLESLREVMRQRASIPRTELASKVDPSLTAMSGALGSARDLFVAASPIGDAALDQVSVRKSDVSELARLVGVREDPLGAVVARLASRPFGESVGTLAETAPEWAERAGKRAQLVVVGREIPVPPRLASVLGGMLTHLVRNAIAHGIERPEARVEASKSPIGVVRLSCEHAARGPRVTVSDDGNGLDLKAITDRAAAMGITTDATSAMFESGVSTGDVDDLAGRGVGLAAVRADARAAGYSISIESQKGVGTTVVLTSATNEGIRDE